MCLILGSHRWPSGRGWLADWVSSWRLAWPWLFQVAQTGAGKDLLVQASSSGHHLQTLVWFGYALKACNSKLSVPGLLSQASLAKIQQKWKQTSPVHRALFRNCFCRSFWRCTFGKWRSFKASSNLVRRYQIAELGITRKEVYNAV